MGQFSWLDCKTDEQIVDDKRRDVYVLVPREFGGSHIKETCYDGYGHFGGYDIFDLIANWNREYIDSYHEYPYSKRVLGEEPWADLYLNLENSISDIENKMRETNKYWEYRYIGIALACYDEDNEALTFPIKITHDPNAIYEWCPPSKSDPNQGWECEDEWDDEEDEWY